MMTGFYVVLQPQALPVFLLIALLVAVVLPLRRATTGGIIRRALASIGLGLLRAVLALFLALGLVVACQISGALIQGAVNVAAHAAAPEPTEQQKQRGPERGA